MTVGEKIQYYRKKSGLSQEELGQKLLVSRQTVSLWEMDKTLPTVDNLLRLRDVFSVSIDALLSDADPMEEAAPQPTETYVFQYEQADSKRVFRGMRRPLIWRGVAFAVACIVLFCVGALADADTMFLGFWLGLCLVGGIGHIRGYAAFSKIWKNNESGLLQSVYSYEVFDDCFAVSVSRNGEIVCTQKVYWNEVEKSVPCQHHLILQSAGRLFILPKDALPSASAFLAPRRYAPKQRADRPTGHLKTISDLLLVFSIVSLLGAMVCVALCTAVHQEMAENMWMFFLFLPVPIGSIAVGFYRKKKGYTYRPNVIVGFIMAALLMVYGSFSFLFAGQYSHSDAPITEVERLLDIDVPTHIQINTHDWTEGTQSIPRGYVYSVSDIFFDAVAVEAFEQSLPADAKWMATIPNDMIGITSYQCDVQEADYYIVYNKDTGELNTLPDADGVYEFINVLYNAERNRMTLVNYRIEYIQ